ncbi:AAA family ATPase [Mycobacterium palustre]|uniref:ATPase n=1 Tax=Mycobacterium palustre TaxID=153971 RepID=A0A1X1ZQD8_9MYCO|nr:AAA family ATPase [Mycobacterium palustre]MCV7099152.1 AAA family ATPase [Mycobacterium palustre]ORW25525.1 ATPase [Mycobacterium palustre]
MRRLDLVVGPNGAGKSTFIVFDLAPLLPGSVVVNADEIARHRWPQDPASHAYDAARAAADTRARLIELGRNFIAETVFSHPSKLDLVRTAQAGGFTVVLHALVVPEELAVERVRHRARAGGHDVPETKIRERHRRLWPLVAEAVARSDIATVYDGARSRGPRIVAQLSGGEVVGVPDWPAWTPEILRSRWPAVD